MAEPAASTVPLPAPALAPTVPAAARRPRLDSRWIAPLFITCILLGAQLSFGVLESYPQTLTAIAASVLTELALGRLLTGKWPHLASAFVTGISVGILIRSPDFWPYALCSMMAITSKYLIRVKGRHIWNPSNFAIVMMLTVAWESVSTLSVQWGNSAWAMLVIWVLGSFIIWNLRRFHICATYVLSFLAFAYLRSRFLGQSFAAEVAPITGPMYQLFIFFMITDPKTTVKSKRGQMVVAFGVALAECVLRVEQNIHAPYYALFTVGPAANLVEIWWDSRRQRAPAS